jgi:hypothetical protein
MLRTYFVIACIFATIIGARAADNYMCYYQEVIEAENMFLSNNYHGSIVKYRSIFNKYPKALLKDVFIALEIACLANEKSEAMYFVKCAFRKGLNMHTVKKIPVVANCIYGTEDQMMTLNRVYEEGKNEYYASIDFFYRNRIWTLMDKDNKAKMIPNNWKPQRIHDSLNSIILDENLCSMIELVNKFGFPSESKIGVYGPIEGSCIDTSTYSILCSCVDVLFFHNRCTFQLLKDKCLMAVQNGDLDPRIYALMYEWSYFAFVEKQRLLNDREVYKCNCKPDSMACLYNMFIHKDLYTKNISFVDACRSKIGMASVKHDSEMEFFAQEHNVRLFFGIFNKY